MRHFSFLLIFLLGLGAGCGLWEVVSSPVSQERLRSGAERVVEEPGYGSLARELSEYLVWVIGAWVAGDKVLTTRRNKLSDRRKSDIEAKVGELEVKVNGGKKAS